MALARHEITTRGVIIGRASSGEGSVRVSLYTEALGLVGALAKSGREERSKLRPHLQTGSYGTYSLVRGASSWRVVGVAWTKNPYTALEGDTAEHARATARVLSVMRQLVHGEAPAPELFDTLWDFLDAVPHLSASETHVAERLAMVRILTALGYVPALSDIPRLAEATFAPDMLQALAPFEKRMVRAINEALIASELTHT
ncbi:MAG: DNA repair protein RecO [Candidatus Paceibacteria bacterium]